MKKQLVLHVTHEDMLVKKHLYLGSIKDIRSRTEYFHSRKIPFHELTLRDRSDYYLMKYLKVLDMSKYKVVLLEYSRYPWSIRYIKKNFPQIRIFIRVHNAEFIHRLHYILARGLFSFENFTTIKDAFLRLRQDYMSAKYADKILYISEWDKNHYWKNFIECDKLVYIPFYLPNQYLKLISKIPSKKLQCICYMSSSMNPFLIDAARNFTKLIKKLPDKFNNWKFYISGIRSPKIKIKSSRIKFTGLVKNPFELITKSQAIAILSDYGTGFKTKILEAICCKSYILVTQKNFEKLPNIIKPFCFVVNKSSVDSFVKALNSCLKPFPKGNPNIIFKKIAFKQMDKLFLK